MAVRDLKSVIYTDDYGRDYSTKIDAALFAQVGASTNPKVGGADYAATPKLPPLPSNLRPRHVVCSASGGNKRRVVCLTPTADLFVGTETTVTLQQLGVAAVTYTVFESVAEKYDHHDDPAQ